MPPGTSESSINWRWPADQGLFSKEKIPVWLRLLLCWDLRIAKANRSLTTQLPGGFSAWSEPRRRRTILSGVFSIRVGGGHLDKSLIFRGITEFW